MEKKEKILKGLKTIPPESICHFITKGDVAAEEVFEALDSMHTSAVDNKKEQIKTLLSQNDDSEWNKALQSNVVTDYRNYLNAFNNGKHREECLSAIDSLDDIAWQNLQERPSKDMLQAYLEDYPNGRHASQVRDYIDDLPWLLLVTKKPKPTIADYQNYQRQYPDKHRQEIIDAIHALQDDVDWDNAREANTRDAYNDYITRHPQGMHVSQARQVINAGAMKWRLLEELHHDKNAYDALTIQNYVGNGVLSWRDLDSSFSQKEIEAIRKYTTFSQLPTDTAPAELQSPSTEAYFWGITASGKTCALGAVLSAANKYGILEKYECQGRYYMDLLCNIFTTQDICTLPEGTSVESIHEMAFSLRDNRDRKHRLSCVDLSGEVFKAVYKKINGLKLKPDEQKALDNTLRYLADRRNRKVHFFIVGYNEHNSTDPDTGLSTLNYLDTMMGYLNSHNIIKRDTNGVYILVTKCDKMDCDVDERKALAEEYVKRELGNFYNNCEQMCKRAGVGDFEVIPFSIGDVFAQTLCRFSRKSTDAVLNKLILKSHAERGSLINWLNS